MFKMIALITVVVIAAVLGLAATKPDTFRVERSATIKAPPEKVYLLLNDFHQWQAGSSHRGLRQQGAARAGMAGVAQHDDPSESRASWRRAR